MTPTLYKTAYSIPSFGLAALITGTDPLVAALSCGMSALTNTVHDYFYTSKEKKPDLSKEAFNAIAPCIALKVSLVSSLSLFAVVSDVGAIIDEIIKQPSLGTAARKIVSLAVSRIALVALTYGIAYVTGFPIPLLQSYIVTNTVIFSTCAGKALINTLYSSVSALFEAAVDNLSDCKRLFTGRFT